jgi:ubiquinone/menaquinone biosynthesis C-methylase UbiE
MLQRLESVRTFFDSDADRYRTDRYPERPATCEQLSYLVRREYVLAMLAEGAPNPGRVLDVGCGPGVYTNALVDRHWQVWGTDLSSRMLVVAKESVRNRGGAEFAVGQTTSLPFPDASFDAIICIGVMAYVEDDEKTVAELARVLKPGGCAVIQLANRYAPIRLEQRLRWIVSRRVLRRAPDEEDRLRQSVTLAVHEPQPFGELCRRFGLMPRSSRFYDFRTPGLVRLWPQAAVAIGRAFETVGDRGWLAWWGSGYLVRLEKARAV